MSNDLLNLKAADFAPAPASTSAELIARPSLSYWQDAARRLRANKRAMASATFILTMILFCYAGPFIWTASPANVNTFQQRQMPSLSSSSWLVIDDNAALPPSADPIPGNFSPSLQATNLRPIGTPNTLSTTFAWDAVHGATAYRLYRNEIEPKLAPGIPLGEVKGTIFSDSMRLLSIPYYYSIIPLAADGREGQATVITLIPKPALSLKSATELAAEMKLPPPKAGDSITLAAHPLGTDQLGRDLLARVMSGGRISLFIGFIAPLFYIAFGVLYGAFAGYIGGAVDNILMRFADFIIALPFLLFMILLKVIIGNRLDSLFGSTASIMVVFVALVILAWPSSARLVRGQILQIRNEAYVQASMMLGAPRFYLILRHMIPNTIGVIIVSLSFAIPGAIFTEAFLSFIGLGVTEPQTSWGALCSDGVRVMNSAPHLLIIPALFISLTVLAFNTLGDGLRDALDAKMRNR